MPKKNPTQPSKEDKDIESQRIQMYRQRMQETVCRLDVVQALLHKPLLYLPTTVECIYLQFRNVLELIATASLVVNDDAQQLLRREGKRKWHAGDILEAVETVNPDYYYPQPIRLVETDREGFRVGVDGYRGEWKEFKGDYLTRDRFTTLYDVCSKIVHTPNPFDKRAIRRSTQADRNRLKQAQKWCKRIVALLTHHQFKLVGEDDRLYICQTVGPNAEFTVFEFKRLDSTTPETVAKERAGF